MTIVCWKFRQHRISLEVEVAETQTSLSEKVIK